MLDDPNRPHTLLAAPAKRVTKATQVPFGTIAVTGSTEEEGLPSSDQEQGSTLQAGAQIDSTEIEAKGPPAERTPRSQWSMPLPW